jgi:hypothetical protein
VGSNGRRTRKDPAVRFVEVATPAVGEPIVQRSRCGQKTRRGLHTVQRDGDDPGNPELLNAFRKAKTLLPNACSVPIVIHHQIVAHRRVSGVHPTEVWGRYTRRPRRPNANRRRAPERSRDGSQVRVYFSPRIRRASGELGPEGTAPIVRQRPGADGTVGGSTAGLVACIALRPTSRMYTA